MAQQHGAQRSCPQSANQKMTPLASRQLRSGGHFLCVDSNMATTKAANATANISVSYMDTGLTPSLAGSGADHPVQTVLLFLYFNMPAYVRPCFGRIISGQGFY